jgi:hypothetical protein
MPTIWLASDSLGSDLREVIRGHLQAKHSQFEIVDLGNFDKYYEGAYKVLSLLECQVSTCMHISMVMLPAQLGSAGRLSRHHKWSIKRTLTAYERAN